jgi:tetratricopeptide (TPR) repeat protein
LAEGFAGRLDAAVNAARRALELDGTAHSRAALAESLLHAGRFAEAEALVRPFADPGASTLERTFALSALSAALAVQGRIAEALRALDDWPRDVGEMEVKRRVRRVEILAVDERRHPEALRELQAVAADPRAAEHDLAIPLALLGDAGGAARLAPALRDEPARALYEAIRSWRAGDLAQARTQAQALAARGGRLRALALWVAARVADQEGRSADVLAAAEAIRGGPDMAPFWAQPELLYLEAEALERLGRRAEARKVVGRLLGWWERADPDLLLLQEAQALGRRVGA